MKDRAERDKGRNIGLENMMLEMDVEVQMIRSEHKF